MSIITPTVGRVVLFRPGPNFTGVAPSDGSPLPALISRVWSDRMINIGGFDADGKPFSATSVPLIQGDEPEGQALPQFYAEWMPYQKGQAAKAEALEAKIAPANPVSGGDNAIEKEIQAKGLTAPRITPADIEANIVDVYYFTAAEGHKYADHPSHELIGYHKQLDLLTICVLILRNGFTVTGESACASPENFDAEIGRKVAYENAKQKLWPLMGYELKQRLHAAADF